MSKSRLEKFLYALYSLDSSDLPNPLSRIEELYKCLVTGEEAPTFEPISRVEKYLMAILGGYDVDSLPNPLSRVEVLLYKLATGDDNLDNVEVFLSEHEELLAEIIRNGGAGGNINIEYVLYTLSTEHNTLYNTAEKPVKSAILKGQTLVNLVGEKRFYNNEGTTTILKGWEFMLPYNLTKGKTYLAVFNATGTISDTNSKVYLMDNDFGSNTGNTANPTIFEAGYNMVKCVASGDNHRVLRIRTQLKNSQSFKVSDVMLIEYQDGMENWDIPYFEGMQSVKKPVLTISNEDGTRTNILTVNEDVELCENGDVTDELNLLTGRLTQRIDENNEVLSQEVVKTVDISTVDQDGNNTKLKTFNDISHVTLSSEGLIPEAELKVATKNEGVLNTMNLEIDDISAR